MSETYSIVHLKNTNSLSLAAHNQWVEVALILQMWKLKVWQDWVFVQGSPPGFRGFYPKISVAAVSQFCGGFHYLSWRLRFYSASLGFVGSKDTLFFIRCVCVSMMCMLHVRRSEDKLGCLVLASPCLKCVVALALSMFRDISTQGFRLSWQAFYPLSHLLTPLFYFWDMFCFL